MRLTVFNVVWRWLAEEVVIVGCLISRLIVIVGCVIVDNSSALGWDGPGRSEETWREI